MIKFLYEEEVDSTDTLISTGVVIFTMMAPGLIFLLLKFNKHKLQNKAFMIRFEAFYLGYNINSQS